MAITRNDFTTDRRKVWPSTGQERIERFIDEHGKEFNTWEEMIRAYVKELTKDSA